MTDQRPYATLLAKGEERRQRILTAAQRLLRRHGWRGITLGQIAREAGVSPAGLLHHFASKEQLLHAALDVRDEYDEARLLREGDLIQQVQSAADRFRDTPDLVGMFAVLLMENLDPEAPLHQRFLGRYRSAVDTVAEGIRRGQGSGRYRADVDPAVKAVEIVAFLNGIETSWLLDPSIPLTEVFKEYTGSLSRQLAQPPDAV
ncbi:TetR/AcrR family transcriptional regulator [Actinomadura sp. 7K507]|uniref:TetR/AcrR family transcriptional regulator n=1 Tax=Actinomadura sp. 7K507 TaxID=2530365 RepID=UPI001053380D|nr:TetR/AcrR family transcriptional regulator [Actinomadura sp. 7K507]TDC97970.1 TetR/AcrR family transcriptional regulator [Actinomadura sp. 7K507]